MSQTHAHHPLPVPVARLAFIAGANVLGELAFEGFEPHAVETPYGVATLYVRGPLALVLRHGAAGGVSPHAINHRAHLWALHKEGFPAVISYCSVGSLQEDIQPGDLMLVDDFIHVHSHLSFFDGSPRVVAPQLSKGLVHLLEQTLTALDEPFLEEGVYYQTTGPRLETKAEVRMIAQFADVVGMTYGHEAALALELGMETACLACVDNMAHGLDPEGAPELSGGHIDGQKALNAARFGRIVGHIAARMAA
jgi:5'-methylthioadenosine phosphorylase